MCVYLYIDSRFKSFIVMCTRVQWNYYFVYTSREWQGRRGTKIAYMDNTKYIKNIEYTVKYSKNINKNNIKKESDEEKEDNP